MDGPICESAVWRIDEPLKMLTLEKRHPASTGDAVPVVFSIGGVTSNSVPIAEQ